jgi:hypothetical protein
MFLRLQCGISGDKSLTPHAGTLNSFEIQGGLNGTSGSLSPSVLAFTLLSIIPPLRETHLSLSPEVYGSPDHAAHYHILGV